MDIHDKTSFSQNYSDSSLNLCKRIIKHSLNFKIEDSEPFAEQKHVFYILAERSMEEHWEWVGKQLLVSSFDSFVGLAEKADEALTEKVWEAILAEKMVKDTRVLDNQNLQELIKNIFSSLHNSLEVFQLLTSTN